MILCPIQNVNQWDCDSCTFENTNQIDKCSNCDRVRPTWRKCLKCTQMNRITPWNKACWECKSAEQSPTIWVQHKLDSKSTSSLLETTSKVNMKDEEETFMLPDDSKKLPFPLKMDSYFRSFCIWKEAMENQIRGWCKMMELNGHQFATQRSLLKGSEIKGYMVKWVDCDGKSFHDNNFRYPIDDNVKQDCVVEPNFDHGPAGCSRGIHLTTADVCLQYAIMSGILPWRRLRLLLCSVPSKHIIEGKETQNIIRQSYICGVLKVRVKFVIPQGSKLLAFSQFSRRTEKLPLIADNDGVVQLKSFLLDNPLLYTCFSCNAEIEFTKKKCTCGIRIPEEEHGVELSRQASFFNPQFDLYQPLFALMIHSYMSSTPSNQREAMYSNSRLEYLSGTAWRGNALVEETRIRPLGIDHVPETVSQDLQKPLQDQCGTEVDQNNGRNEVVDAS